MAVALLQELPEGWKSQVNLLLTWFSSLFCWYWSMPHSAFCFVLTSFYSLFKCFLLCSNFIPYSIFYSIYLIVQFPLFFTFGIPVNESNNVKRQEKEICIQVKLLYISLKQNRLKYNSWTWRQSRSREGAWKRRK